MTRAHEHLSITDLHFDVFCEQLEQALKEHGGDDEALKEVFIFIEPLREKIVNRNRAKPLVERIGGLKKIGEIVDREFEIVAENE